MITPVGWVMGDKWLQGKVPNLKFGEVRYYPQDNQNIDQTKVREISKKTFLRILKKYFPEYTIELELQDDMVWSVGVYVKYGDEDESFYKAVVKNKGYICFKEATAVESGCVIYLHDGYVLCYKELWLCTAKPSLPVSDNA